MDDDVTGHDMADDRVAVNLATLAWRVGHLESRLESELNKVAAAIAGLNVVRMDQYIAERDASNRRIAELEDSHKWTVRMLAGVVVTFLSSIVALIVWGPGGPP